MENKRKTNLKRARNANMRGFYSALSYSFKSMTSAYTLVVLLTFGLVQSGESTKAFDFNSSWESFPPPADSSSGNLNGVGDKKIYFCLCKTIINEGKIT